MILHFCKANCSLWKRFKILTYKGISVRHEKLTYEYTEPLANFDVLILSAMKWDDLLFQE